MRLWAIIRPISKATTCLSSRCHGTTCRSSSRSSTRKKARISTGCRPRRNGNTPAARAPPPATRLAILTRCWASMRGTLTIQAVRPIRSVRRSRTPGGSMTCTAMSGNGCRMPGIAITMAHRPTAARGKNLAPTGSFGAAAGAAPPGTAARQFAATTPGAAATTSAFASCERYKSNYLLLYHATTSLSCSTASGDTQQL